MSATVTRRTAVAASATLLASSASAAPQKAKLRKSVVLGMLPGNMPMEDRLKMLRDTGFEGVEAHPVHGRPLDEVKAEAEKMRKAADSAGIKIHSIIFGGWHAPLSSPDPAVIERGMTDVRNNLIMASMMGADSLLLVPAVVNAKVRYSEAWTRSHANIKQLIPDAEKAKCRINIEEVWNNFLLSPVEFAKYIDDFKSKYVQAYFDVGNVVRFAWPQDWIRTLGKRIQRLHIKDFKGGPGLGTGGQWVNLWEGSIEWPEVKRALDEIAYDGWMTCELGGGDEAYFKDLSARVDRIINAA